MATRKFASFAAPPGGVVRLRRARGIAAKRRAAARARANSLRARMCARKAADQKTRGRKPRASQPAVSGRMTRTSRAQAANFAKPRDPDDERIPHYAYTPGCQSTCRVQVRCKMLEHPEVVKVVSSLCRISLAIVSNIYRTYVKPMFNVCRPRRLGATRPNARCKSQILWAPTVGQVQSWFGS